MIFLAIECSKKRQSVEFVQDMDTKRTNIRTHNPNYFPKDLAQWLSIRLSDMPKALHYALDNKTIS